MCGGGACARVLAFVCVCVLEQTCSNFSSQWVEAVKFKVDVGHKNYIIF